MVVVRQSIVSQIGIHEMTFNMWLQAHLPPFRIFYEDVKYMNTTLHKIDTKKSKIFCIS